MRPLEAVGKTIAKILAVVAEAELDASKARNKAPRETMRKTGRWPGGLVPFGRRAVTGDGGFTLELDPEYGPTLMKMIWRFIEKPRFSAVADWLNDQGVPTAQDIARIRAAAGESTTRLADPKPRGSQMDADRSASRTGQPLAPRVVRTCQWSRSSQRRRHARHAPPCFGNVSL